MTPWAAHSSWPISASSSGVGAKVRCERRSDIAFSSDTPESVVAGGKRIKDSLIR